MRKQWKIGYVVFVKEGNLPTLKWTFGKTERILPAKNNKVAKMKAASGHYKRSTTKLFYYLWITNLYIFVF